MPNPDTQSTFERLVHTLESSERQEMLRQLAENMETSALARETPMKEGKTVDTLANLYERKLEGEPFLIRLWFSLVAFFTSSSATRAYSRHLVSELGRGLAKSYPDYFDLRQRVYTEGFYGELTGLSKVKAYFAELLSAYENDKGGFYQVLASLVMTESMPALLKASDPFAFPPEEETTRDVRLSVNREIDRLIQGITESERSRMYQCAQGIEWMRSLCEVPLERMALRFSNLSGTGRTCLIDSLSEDMKLLSNVLAGSGRIPLILLESLFLFARQGDVGKGGFDLESETRQFVDAAVAHLETVRHFKTSVPVSDFVRYTIQDVSWHALPVEGGEDWFALFRGAWKRRFDRQWADWDRTHRYAMLKKRIESFLGLPALPSLIYKPWEGLWMPFLFRRELSYLFLKGFFSVVYPANIMKSLKILMIEGEFYRRENMIEYTDAFSTLDNQQAVLDAFENRLSPKGDIGQGFEFIVREKIATVKGKARLENLMLTIDSESALIIGRIMGAFRSIDLILRGVLGVVRGGPYETLVNMASIQGKQNEKYRKELSTVRELIKAAASILSDAEVLEKESL